VVVVVVLYEAGASVEGGYAIETDGSATCPDCGALLDLIVINREE